MRIFGYEIRRHKPQHLAYVGEIAKVQVSDGDVMVIIPERPLADEHVAVLASVWEKNIGDKATLLFMDAGTKLAVISPDTKAKQLQAALDKAALDELAYQIKSAEV